MISEENKQILIQHLKSMGVTLGFMILAVTADFAAHNLGLFNLTSTTAVVIGAILGHIAQWATERYTLGAKARAFASAIRARMSRG